MNKITAILFSTLFAATATFGAALSPKDLGCEDARDVIKGGGELEPGKWYLDWETCKNYADKNGMPVLFIWSNKSCVHCQYTDLVFVQDSFKDWAAKNNAGKVIYCFMAGGESKYPDQQGSKAYNWMYYGGGAQLNAFPFVVLWWQAKGVNKRYTGDDFCSGNATGTKFNSKTNLNEKSLPDRVANVIEKMEAAFKDWNPVRYAGGNFRAGTEHDRLEAEATTQTVRVDVTREATEAMSQIYTISAAGKTTRQVTLDWAKGEKKKTIVIADFNTAWFAAGKAVTLKLYDGTKTTDKVMSTTTIACVTPANSTGNPDFKGCSAFGQWTMDLEAAKTKVNGTGGDAWTLVCVQGSLWCPDCGRVEKNFLGVEDASGNNRFTAWAKSKNIALVTVDIPNFNSNSSTAASPCLLKKDAYTTDPEGSGTKTSHSGLGYLTRKMVSDADARTMLERNWELASKMTSEGGFNRPEERDYKGRTYRCGAPIFVLLDKNGKVRAELVRLAEDSPTDTSNYDNYIKRFEEMIDIAKNNATEIENNYASSGSITISASGVEKARLCNADMYDTFKVGGNAKQKVVVKGDSAAGFDADCKVTVEFQKLEGGKAVTLGTAKSGLLKDGVTQEYTFTSGGTYYVQVRGWGPKTDTESRSAGYNSSAFAATSSTAGHFQNYTVTLTTVLMPQEDKATYSYLPATGKVSMNLVKGTLYRITGMASCAGLQSKGNDLYAATVTGETVIVLPGQGGTLEYQIWKPGALGFAQIARTVARSVCDVDGKALPIKVSRTGGRSGAAGVTVSVDPGQTTIADKNRYWLTPKSDGHEHSDAVEKIDLKWADGDAAEKTVYLYIDDDQTWDGFGTVTLQLAVNDGAAEIAESKGNFKLSVLPEVIEAPGKVVMNGAEPALAGKKIYAEVGTGVKLWLERKDGFDGQVAGILQSSVAGVKFAVAEPRDLARLADSDPKLLEKYGRRYGADAQLLYWASSEGGEKYVEVTGIPAGETAKITFIPIGELTGGKVTATIVSVGKDAPRFGTPVCEFKNLYRYMAFSESIKVLNTVSDGKVQLKKLSGKIPSGLKFAYNAADKALVISGVPTKAGEFEAVYQVVETRGGKKVEGLTVQLKMLVTDIVTGEPGDKPINPTIAKSRTFKNLPVFATEGEERTRLVGLLQVTLPKTGKASAKFTGFDGSTSFSAKSWNGIAADGTTLEVTLADKKYGRTLVVEVEKDGSIAAELAGDEKVNGCVAWSDGKVWSKTDPARPWKGYYTVALQNKGPDFEETKGIAPTGDGYLTLKMDSDSACNSGTFKVAGVLPNGTKISCSSVLFREDGAGILPIFKVSSKDALAAAVTVLPNAMGGDNRRCVDSSDLFDGYWRHDDKAGSSYAVNFRLCGSYYDKNEDLGGCCADFFGQTDLKFYIDGDGGSMPGRAQGTYLADIKVGADTITVMDQRGSKLTCRFARATGVVTGKFTYPGLGESMAYVGVVVNGWGDGCGCGPADVYLPFVSGSYQYTDDGRKCGGMIGINK